MSEAVEGLVSEAPAVEAPIAETPVVEAPVVEAPIDTSFADSLGDYSSLAEKYGDIQGVAKALTEAQKEISSRKAPESPSEYTLPEVEGFKWNDDTLEIYGPKLHGLGISQEHANELLTMHAQGLIQSAQMAEKANEANLNALKESWGEKYDSQITAANKAIEKLGGDALFEALENNPLLGSNPEIIKAFAKVAELTSESSLPNNQAPSGKMSAAEATSKMSELLDKKAATYNQSERVAYQAEIDKLHAVIDGR